MGLLSRMLGAGRAEEAERIEPTISNSLENPSTNLSDPQQWMIDFVAGGVPAGWGSPVSERSAMTVSAVYRSVVLLSGIVASLPRKIYRRTPDGREEAPNHRLAPLLQVAPDPGQPETTYLRFERLMGEVLLGGNHYAIIRYDNAARVTSLEAVMMAEPIRLASGRVVYRCTLVGGATEYHDFDDMLHVAGPGFDGLRSPSRIGSFARQSVALAALTQDQAGRALENAARPSGVLEVPPSISENGFKRLRAEFTSRNVGGRNAGRTFFADQGAKYTPLQMSLADLSAIELLRYSVADVSRFFGTPLHLLNETDKSTSWGSGLSESTLAFLIFTLGPDLERIETEHNRKLFSSGDYYFEIDRRGLLAMDPLKAAQVAQAEVSFGGLTPNEYRRAMNRPGVEGGDVAFINSTNVAISRQIADPVTPPPQPPKPAK